MKRIFFSFLLAVGAFFTGNASDGLFPSSKNTFSTSFAGAKDVKWEYRQGYEVASFTLDGSYQSAYYDSKGELVVLARQIFEDALPAGLKASLQPYSSRGVVTTIFEMQSEGVTTYFATVVEDGKQTILQSKGKKWKTLKTAAI